MAGSDREDDIRRWAEKLFYPVSLKGKVPKKDTTSKKLGSSAAKALSGHARIREQIARTTRRSPEVMVKITNRLGAGKGMAAIRNHLTYISRNGKLELETDTGERLTDKEGLTSFATELKTHVRGQPIPEVSKRREAFNIILSMPSGTPANQVREAAKIFLDEEFGNKHRYCFALHTDTDKPHVHACVLAAPVSKRKRLNPRKADLQRWREGFAEQLRELGIDANATPRWARGSTQRSISQSGHHAKKRTPIKFIEIMNPVEWPRVYKSALTAWQKISKALSRSSSKADQDTASQIEEFIDGKKPEIPRIR